MIYNRGNQTQKWTIRIPQTKARTNTQEKQHGYKTHNNKRRQSQNNRESYPQRPRATIRRYMEMRTDNPRRMGQRKRAKKTTKRLKTKQRRILQKKMANKTCVRPMQLRFQTQQRTARRPKTYQRVKIVNGMIPRLRHT
jgi:hypothetical protein